MNLAEVKSDMIPGLLDIGLLGEISTWNTYFFSCLNQENKYIF